MGAQWAGPGTATPHAGSTTEERSRRWQARPDIVGPRLNPACDIRHGAPRSAARPQRRRIAVVVAQVAVLPHPFVEAPRLAVDRQDDAAHGRKLAQRALDLGVELGAAATRRDTRQQFARVVQVDVCRARSAPGAAARQWPPKTASGSRRRVRPRSARRTTGATPPWPRPPCAAARAAARTPWRSRRRRGRCRRRRRHRPRRRRAARC